MNKKPNKIRFDTIIEKFGKKGEKSGWTYIKISNNLAERLMPGNRKSFRVKGYLDKVEIRQSALIPMGEGNFILPLNASLRKALAKRAGHSLKVDIQVDITEIKLDQDFKECLDQDIDAKKFFYSLPDSHRNYFSKWIQSARTSNTKTRRIALALNALSQQQDFGAMLRATRNKQ